MSLKCRSNHILLYLKQTITTAITTAITTVMSFCFKLMETEKKMSKGTRKSNGEGTVYFVEKEGCWRAEITWIDGGVKHRKTWRASKQSDAKTKLTEFKKQLLLNGTEVPRESKTFRDFANEWVDVILKPKVKPLSYERKISTLNNQVYKHIGDIPISKLTHSQIQKMVNDLTEKGLSYSTVKKAYEAVSACLRYYRITTSTSFNTCEGITLPEMKRKSESDINFFTEEERKRILKEATRKHQNGKYVYRLGWVFILLLYSGLRVGELCALTWNDIDFDNRIISVSKNAVEITEMDERGNRSSVLKTQNSTKTKSGIRAVPMTQKAFESLSELQKITGEYEYIVTSSKGVRIRPTRLNKTFHQILKAAGLGCVGVHTLRHTFATMLFNNGCEVKIVSELLGHSNTKITENTYIHLIQQQKVKAIQSIDRYSD